ASHEVGIERAVVPAPDVAVVLEDRLGRNAERGLPRDAIPGPIRDDEVRDQARVEPAVHLLAAKHARDRTLAVLRIRQTRQAADELGPERLVRRTRVDDPARLPPPDGQVNVAEPHRVRPRPGPLDAFPELTAREEGLQVLPLRIALERQIPVLDEPGV